MIGDLPVGWEMTQPTPEIRSAACGQIWIRHIFKRRRLPNIIPTFIIIITQKELGQLKLLMALDTFRLFTYKFYTRKVTVYSERSH